MKKTIAILLVLVIAMAGVWAATADLELTTSKAGFNSVKLTADTVSATTYEQFNLLTPLTTKALTYSETTVEGVTTADALSVGYLSYMTNKGTPLSVTVAATHFDSTTVSTDITYSLKLGSADAVLSQTPAVYASLTQSSAITLVATAGVLTIDDAAILVTINKSSYDNAAAATDYKANVYFTYSAT